MLPALVVLLTLAVQEPPPRPTSRPEPPMTEEQRRQDERYRITEGERAGDAATPDRIICDLRRVPGSNLRVRHCSTVDDRRRARAEAQSVFGYGPAPASANR